MTISEWEFFHVLEGHLSDALHALVGGSVQSHCPREVVKYVGKNYDAIFPLETQHGLAFTSSAFFSINQVLNAKHHRLERQWAIVDEAVAQSLRILKDLEKFNISTAASVKELQLLWPQVDKSELAFAHRNNLFLAKVAEIPPFPDMGAVETQKNVQIALSVPEGLISTDIVEYLREVQEIPLMDVDVSQQGTITFTVASQTDVASILPDFTYSRKKIATRIVQRITLTLYPLAETKTVDHVRMALKSMDITPVHIHEPDRAKKTVNVEVGSQEDANFIKENGVNMKPQNLTVLEHRRRPYVVYLDVPLKSHEFFKVLWENHYGFLPEAIHFSDDLRSAAFVLDENQSSRVAKAPVFVVNWRKVLVVPYSPFRITMTFSSPMDMGRVQAALANLSLPGTFSVHVPFDNSEENNNANNSDFLLAYVHTGDASTKAALLSNEIRVAPFKPSPTPPPAHTPLPPTPLPTTSTAPSPQPTAPPPAKPSRQTGEAAAKNKNFAVSVSRDEMVGNPTAPDVRQALIAASGKHECGKWTITFVFEREGKFYADVFCEKPDLAAQVQSAWIGTKQVAVHHVDEVPYYLLKLESIPPSLDITKLFNYFKKEAKIFVGQIKLKYGDAIVPCAHSDFQAFLAKKVVKINNVAITVSDATAFAKKSVPAPDKNPLRERKTTMKFVVAQFLKRKKKDDLDNIASEFSVKIQVTSQKQKDNIKKPHEDKSATAKPQKLHASTPVQHFLLVRGSNDTNVAQASERVTFLINENEFKQLNFKYANEKLFSLAHGKLLGCLKEFNSHDMTYCIKKISDIEFSVHLFGTASVVEEAEQSANSVRELACTEVDIPATLELEFATLETKYDVKTEFDKSGGKLKIFGSKESVAELTEHIQSKINNIKTSAHVKFLKEPFLFAQKFVFNDPKWLTKVKEMEVEVKFNEASGSVNIKGAQANMRTVKDEILKLKSAIVEKKIQMTINKHILTLLQEHLMGELAEGVFCNVRDLSSAQEVAQEDEEDMDDGSSTSSDLSVGTSTSIKSASSNISATSNISTTSKAANAKVNKTNITVEVGAWYFSDLEGRVAQVFEGLKKGAEVQKIKYTPEDAPGIQKAYNFAYVQKRNRVNIHNCFSAKTLVVSGFSRDRVKQACEVITNTIQRNANKVARIPVNKHVFFFLRHKREMFLAQLKQQLNLKRVQLVHNKAHTGPSAPPVSTAYSTNKLKNAQTNDKSKGKNSKNNSAQNHKDGFFVEAEGHPAKVERLEQELANIVIRYEKVKVQFVTASSLKEFEDELKESYDVSTFVKDLPPGFEISVTGERNLPYWKEIMDKLESLKGVSEDYKPSDYARLAEIVLSKKELDLQSFKTEYNLFKTPSFNREKSTVLLVAQKKEDITAASEALEGILSNKRIETAVIILQEKEFVSFFITGGPHAKRVDEIVKKYKVSYQWRIPSLIIRGPKDVLHKAKQELETDIQGIIKNIATKTIQLSTYIAAELSKENNSMCKDCFIQSGVLVTFPEIDAVGGKDSNPVMMEINLPNCKIQIVQGDITKEPTKCIVNAANSTLSHAGGIAHDIAQKAGEEFNQLCAKLVTVRGPVAPGTCVITAAGNIPPPINHVIHTVGPQWHGGLYNEAQILTNAIKSALALAEDFKIPSISLPTVSAGIYGYPIQECSQIIAQAIYKYASVQSPTSHLKQIRICEKDAAIVKILVESLKGAKEGKVTMADKKQSDHVGLVYQWSWMEDVQAKTWKPFDPNENFQIEIAYLAQGRKGKMVTSVTGDLNQVKNGFTYEIDFDAMTEINTKFRATLRPIKREPCKQTRNFMWEIQAGQQGEWIKFDQVENQQIELAFFERKFPVMSLKWKNTQLLLDFQQMREKNTGLKLNRADVHYENELQNRNQKLLAHKGVDTEEVKKPQNDTEDTVKCNLLGNYADLPKGELWIQNKIKEMTTTDVVSFERNIPVAITKELPALKKKYGVTLQSEKNKITLAGLRMQVVQAKTEILEIERSSSSTFKAPPSYWEPQKEDLELKEIADGSAEWQKIEKRIAETIASAKIIQIQRIQNLSQWEKYCFLKDRIARKNNNNAAECFLFHGTKGNSPTLIYTGDDGFDMRYSAQGMWGRASYFAQNASYSHNYGYRLPNGHYQMFYARVAVGKTNHIPSDSTIVKPAEGFDSVSGETGKSIVYMVYENGRAYPEYLVTYSA